MVKRKVTGLLVLFFVIGCRNTNPHKEQKKDEFYSITGGWDWIRVPLISPYEALRVNPEIETTWGIEFIHSLGVDNVKKVDVIDSIIYIMSGKVGSENDSTLVNLENVPTGWFIIDTRKKTERGFSSAEDFNNHIIKNKFLYPKWHDIDSLSKALSNGGQLPWISM